jgi:isoleucyl-tRNA synthetase
VLDHLFGCIVTWLAPMLCFTAEEAWLTRFPGEQESVHLKLFPEVPAEWRNDALAEKFAKVRAVRRVVTGALELERAEKRIGASLEAAPILYLSDPDLLAALDGLDMAEICITSGFEIRPFDAAPADAFRLSEASEKAAVAIARASGEKCARCWMLLPDVGRHEEAPGTCERCAQAVAAA